MRRPGASQVGLLREGDGGSFRQTRLESEDMDGKGAAGPSRGGRLLGPTQFSTISSLVYATARRLSFTGERPSAISLSFSSSARGARLLTQIFAWIRSYPGRTTLGAGSPNMPCRSMYPVRSMRTRSTGMSRSEEHTSELQSRLHLVFPLLLLK